MVSPVIDMPNYNGKSWPTSGRATQLLTQHSGETPLRGGFAQSLTHASNTVLSYQASWHSFVDPICRVRQIPWYRGAWTQGLANGFAIGVEITGYAAFTEAQWLTPEGVKQLENLAHEWVYYWRIEESIGNRIDLRWLSDWEVRAVMNGDRTINGFCTHGQIEPASRWDPGPNFPKTRLMNRIKQLINGAPAPVRPATPPVQKDWFDMATEADLERVVEKVLTKPAVMDKLALHLLKRDCYLVDPTGKTFKIVGTTNLATKINYMAHNDAEILGAVKHLGSQLVIIGEALDIHVEEMREVHLEDDGDIALDPTPPLAELEAGDTTQQ